MYLNVKMNTRKTRFTTICCCWIFLTVCTMHDNEFSFHDWV